MRVVSVYPVGVRRPLAVKLIMLRIDRFQTITLSAGRVAGSSALIGGKLDS
jgi:hypothetical protein